MRIVDLSYNVTREFPKFEIYGLTSQIRRAAVSVPSNIAEGFKREHRKEFRQFLNISRGSLAELETQLPVAGRLQYIQNRILLNDILNLIDQNSRMITSLMGKIASKSQS